MDSLLDPNHFSSSNSPTEGQPSNPASSQGRLPAPLAKANSGEGHSLTNLSQDSGLTTSDSQLYGLEDANSFSSTEDFQNEGSSSKDRIQSASKRLLAKYPGYQQQQQQQVMGDFHLPGQVPQSPQQQAHVVSSSRRASQDHQSRLYHRRTPRRDSEENQQQNQPPQQQSLHLQQAQGPVAARIMTGGGSNFASRYHHQQADQAFVVDTTGVFSPGRPHPHHPHQSVSLPPPPIHLLRRTTSEESVIAGTR